MSNDRACGSAHDGTDQSTPDRVAHLIPDHAADHGSAGRADDGALLRYEMVCKNGSDYERNFELEGLQ